MIDAWIRLYDAGQWIMMNDESRPVPTSGIMGGASAGRCLSGDGYFWRSIRRGWDSICT